jgi:hypothetical protein
MGIDIYMKWKGQTEDEHKAQITGFSTGHGHTGYLREAYHGGPYATRVLVPEAFEHESLSEEDEELGPVFKAATLRERLPETIKTAMVRAKKIYKEKLTEDDPAIQSFVKFVELAEKLEAEGKQVHVYASY